MNRTDINTDVLQKTSRNTAQAYDALYSAEYDHIPEEDKLAWAMACVIHCDITRFLVAISESEAGVTKLLWMAELVSKLFEAEMWYAKKGVLLLENIAKRNDWKGESVRDLTSKLRTDNSIDRIKKFRKYRNKLSFHYERNALDHLRMFGEVDTDEFYNIVKSFVKFSQEWADLTKQVVSNEVQA